MKLRDLLGSPAAARFVCAQVALEAALLRRQGMDPAGARDQAIREGGTYWIREFLNGVYIEVDGERLHPRRRALPAFLSRPPALPDRQEVLL